MCTDTASVVSIACALFCKYTDATVDIVSASASGRILARRAKALLLAYIHFDLDTFIAENSQNDLIFSPLSPLGL